MDFTIRPYHPSDLTSLYHICLKTGDSGKDASKIYSDPDLLGHIYVGPYAVYEPELCFVVTDSDKPYGYILGTKDSKKFYKKCENEWFPVLRNQYPIPAEDDKSQQAAIIRKLHRIFEDDTDLVDYPAHLHIDLLPEAQGYGLGRKLIEVFADRLRDLKVKGLHLEVGKKNEGAVIFYERVGFKMFKELEYSIVFAMELK